MQSMPSAAQRIALHVHLFLFLGFQTSFVQQPSEVGAVPATSDVEPPAPLCPEILLAQFSPHLNLRSKGTYVATSMSIREVNGDLESCLMLPVCRWRYSEVKRRVTSMLLDTARWFRSLCTILAIGSSMGRSVHLASPHTPATHCSTTEYGAGHVTKRHSSWLVETR